LIYVRVSTDDQANKGYSIPAQLKSCRTKAKELGADNIVELVDDGHSGAFLDRPGMNQLREIIRNKKDSLQQKRENVIVLCYDPDRFARNLTHQLIITEEIENSGASLEFINFEWQNTPEGRLFYSIRGAVSAYEREKIKERSVRGKRAKAEAGKVPDNSKPYGYMYDEELKSYVINEEEAEMVRQIFKWYIEEKIGLAKIAERLLIYGYPTRLGRNQWAISSIHGIITNEMYTGTTWAFKTYKHKIGPKKIRKRN
jgi:site-specific DNA recombinase